MTPKKMNKTLKAILVVSIVAAMALLYFANQKLTSMAEQTARLKAESQVAEQQIQTYQKTKEKVESLDYVNELAGKVLPENEEQSVIVAELSQFALRSRLSVAQINFPESNTGSSRRSTTETNIAVPKGVATIPITIQFADDSRYENLLEFLRYVEENRRKMQVTNISLTPNSEDRSRLSEVTVSINLYSKSTQVETEEES